MIDEINRLHSYLKNKYGPSMVTLTTFPSGAATLDMKIDNTVLMLEYLPQEGFSVSRVEKEDDALDPNKCVIFGKNEFDNARDCFLSLLPPRI